MKLIDKAVVVAEIEKLINEIYAGRPFVSLSSDQQVALWYIKSIMSSIDTLEVKEVDLEKEIDDYINEHFSECDDGVLISDANSTELTLLDATSIARHFYELELKAQKGETELLKVKGFLVRDKDDYTVIYAEKPHRGKIEWVDSNNSCLMTINDARLVPDIEFEDEPVEVEVTLKRLKDK